MISDYNKLFKFLLQLKYAYKTLHKMRYGGKSNVFMEKAKQFVIVTNTIPSLISVYVKLFSLQTYDLPVKHLYSIFCMVALKNKNKILY